MPQPATVSRDVVADLVREHLGMAHRIAGAVARRLPRWIALDDLRSAASVGLVEAAHRFDATRGEPFVAFAEPRIRGAILDELRRGDVLGRHGRRAARELGQTIAKLEGELGRRPEDDEVAAALGLTLAAYHDRLELTATTPPVELTPAIERRLRDDRAPDAALIHDELVRRVTTALAALAPRELEIMHLYHVVSLSYVEIGQRLGISESRVCQLRGRAIARLREALATEA